MQRQPINLRSRRRSGSPPAAPPGPSPGPPPGAPRDSRAPGSPRGAFVVHGLAWALLGLVVVVSLMRGVGLARGHALGTARGERLWHSFADSHPGLGGRLATLRPQLAPGETVWLVVPAGRYQERWLRTMARYHWPEQTVAGVYERGAPGVAPPPPEVTRVVLTRDGDATVVRGPSGG